MTSFTHFLCRQSSKEVNSSLPRIQDAFVDQLVASVCPPNDENCIGYTAADLVKDVLDVRPNLG